MKLYQTSNARHLALEDSEGHPSAVLKHHALLFGLFSFICGKEAQVEELSVPTRTVVCKQTYNVDKQIELFRIQYG